jgi:hypothetical protein
VVVLHRDRIARGVYAQLLAGEFCDHGARLVALNTRGDDSPDGELGDNILDVIAAWERKKIAERMNRGKRRKAREGKLVACPQPDYGFRYNDARDGYEVDPPRMALIQRIFRMIGVEGMTLNAVARRFEAEGIPSPGGKRFWNCPGLRKLIMSDVYLAHTYEQVAQIVSPEVASRLDPEKRYGISWYGRQRHTYTQAVRIKDGKKTYPSLTSVIASIRCSTSPYWPMRTAASSSSGLLARTFVEITNLYLLVVAALRASERTHLAGAECGDDGRLVPVEDVAAFLALLPEGHDRAPLVYDHTPRHLYRHATASQRTIAASGIIVPTDAGACCCSRRIVLIVRYD